ncbi:MAG: hypothetical protein A3F72_13290 [Bacteroidetes bacterium RIFCSPLOWO2_12_FULL_35_15]|nr:MAG: hypothetical protein A3F72_13290 [Bacteroidetes bacterium RIFCSPLOWO2_12_FULL_35_15]
MENPLELTGQSFKSIREHYKMSYEDFKDCIAPIKEHLDKMTSKKNYRNLLPKQVELIIKHLEG